MNHGITEGLRKSLADLRENEERCRDAALAIQRVLEAEGALYPVQALDGLSVSAVPDMPNIPPPPAKRMGTGAEAPAKAAPKISRKAAKIAKKTTLAAQSSGMKSRVCVICNKMFLPKAGVQKACSPACVKEKNRRYAMAKYHTNVNIRKGLAAAIKAPVAAPTPEPKVVVCAVCGLPFVPKYVGQKTCSVDCAKELRQRNGGPA